MLPYVVPPVWFVVVAVRYKRKAAPDTGTALCNQVIHFTFGSGNLMTFPHSSAQSSKLLTPALVTSACSSSFSNLSLIFRSSSCWASSSCRIFSSLFTLHHLMLPLYGADIRLSRCRRPLRCSALDGLIIASCTWYYKMANSTIMNMIICVFLSWTWFLGIRII